MTTVNNTNIFTKESHSQDINNANNSQFTSFIISKIQ
jgi:hypothetical protein